jgi:hypothetical protein
MKWRPSLAQQRSSGHSVANVEVNALATDGLHQR